MPTIAYVTFQPELQRQREEREGTFEEVHNQQNENAISQAIISDFQEAKQQALDTSKTGPAWKLRQMLFGRNPEHPDHAPKAEQKPAVAPQQMKDTETKRDG